MKKSDFSAGDRFELLQVLGGPFIRRVNRKSRHFYSVICECGATKYVRKESLRVAVSCGCLNAKVNLAGQVFGRLTVLSAAPQKRSHWNCKCTCGKLTTVRADSLVTGNTQSCGCLIVDRHLVKHGYGSRQRNTPTQRRTYNAWAGLKQRGLNLQNRDAHKYSARGVTIDPRWLKFENFLADMGECPEGMSIDRYPDNNGNYTKENCRWATPKEQANNTRRTIKVTYQGGSVTISDLVAISGKDHRTIYDYLKRGFSAEEAIAA